MYLCLDCKLFLNGSISPTRLTSLYDYQRHAICKGCFNNSDGFNLTTSLQRRSLKLNLTLFWFGLDVCDFKAWFMSVSLESCYEKNVFNILFTDQRCLKKKSWVALVCFDNLDIYYLTAWIHPNFLIDTRQTDQHILPHACRWKQTSYNSKLTQKFTQLMTST